MKNSEVSSLLMESHLLTLIGNRYFLFELSDVTLQGVFHTAFPNCNFSKGRSNQFDRLSKTLIDSITNWEVKFRQRQWLSDGCTRFFSQLIDGLIQQTPEQRDVNTRLLKNIIRMETTYARCFFGGGGGGGAEQEGFRYRRNIQ